MILDILRKEAGLGSVVWRPAFDMLKEEGVESDTDPALAESDQSSADAASPSGSSEVRQLQL